MSNEQIKLKPCPFCGEIEKISYNFSYGYIDCTGDADHTASVECAGCDAEVWSSEVHYSRAGAANEAARKWNRRAGEEEE